MNNLIRLRPPHAAAEANHGGRFYLPHIDGHVYVESEDVAGPLVKTGGYARVDYPKFPPEVWAAIGALTDALDGSERQMILDACECILQSFVPSYGEPVEQTYPST